MSNFFEELGNKAKGMFTKAQEAVECGCDRFLLSQDIQAQRLAVNQLFAELGRLAYHGCAELAGVRPKQEIVVDIEAAVDKLNSLEEQYESLTLPQEEPSKVTDIEMNIEPQTSCFCHKCGTPQPDGNDFCHKCGTKLNK